MGYRITVAPEVSYVLNCSTSQS